MTATDTWQDAYDAIMARIEAHPRFRQLVREVAVAEQPNHPGQGWLSRNSRSYGVWMTRGMPYVDTKRRARKLAQEIALELWPDDDPVASLGRENVGRVYGAASRWVRSRRSEA